MFATQDPPETAEPRWLERLNDAQRTAVTHEGPSLLVVAGAGTGKTGTLAARVAHLIEGGTRPERILLLPDGVEDLWSADYRDLVALA